ncbi:MAG: VOC family protein [Candidatus Harrisonbacteria bacterium]|nr:VOC family protein [Candidatus Harrisonbacteria bacterium]
MQKITPFLWFDTQAEEAANLYTSLFKNSKIGSVSRYGKAGSEVSGMPEGTIMTIEFELEGQKFVGLNGGPEFKLNPSVSFLVACSTKEEVDALWEELSKDGKALMELDEYPFSERYGWIEDRYGLSWQIMFAGDQEIKQKITPSLLFVGEQCTKAEEAINFYASVFSNAKVGDILRYGKGEEPDKEGTVKFASFTLEGQEFFAMDSAREHNFGFNEALSFAMTCKDQKEIDYFWEKLSQGGEEGPCGWLKDRYGLSWQIVPAELTQLLQDKEGGEKAMQAMLKMKKIDIEGLKGA